MNPLLARLRKTSTVEEAEILAESEFFNERDSVHVGIPMIDVALSGDIDGGFTPGITMWAGPSKHFKTMFSLIMAKTYMEKYPDAVMLFYDSEFGTPLSYFDSLKIDTSRVLHIPLLNLEQLKFDIVAQLEEIKKGDKVIIVIDSVGNIASKKEVEDAKEQKSVADMSRAKQLKSMFRMITPYLVLRDIPCVVVNHTYKEQCMAGDTLIKTSDGIKELQHIKQGDFVYALTGLKEVLATYSPIDIDATDKKFLELEFDDGHVVRCTHDHKFYVSPGEWVKAIDMKIGQEMY